LGQYSGNTILSPFDVVSLFEKKFAQKIIAKITMTITIEIEMYQLQMAFNGHKMFWEIYA